MQEISTQSDEKATLIIHRAANEIGGNCVEVSAQRTRVLFDFGLPLRSIAEKKPPRAYRLPLDGVYADDKPAVKAVFLTHAHPDHYGLLGELHPQIPVYASPVTIKLLRYVAPLLGFGRLGRLRFIAIHDGEKVKLGPITVTARAVDHSVPQALAYEICAAQKRIVYTGDLRTHSYCSYLTLRLASLLRPDYLLVEGTSLGRSAAQAEPEEAVCKRLARLFAGEKKLPVIYFSALNGDRFVSVYKAAREAGKTLVIDPYTCFVVEQMAQAGLPVPFAYWRGIRVYFAPNSFTRRLKAHLKRFIRRKISLQEILSAPQQFIIKDNFSLRRSLLRRKQDLYFIHSAWEGYLREADNTFRQDALAHGFPLDVVHTSGHADVPSLQGLVREMNPKRIVPIHTACAANYSQFFNVPVCILQNGDRLAL